MDKETGFLELGWYGNVVGKFRLSGSGRRMNVHWQGENHPYGFLFDGENKTSEPRLLKTLAPEGWLSEVLDSPDPVTYIGEGIRFLSNLTISPNTKALCDRLDIDRVHVRLKDCTDENGVYTGLYGATCPSAINGAFEKQLASYWNNPLMPKFSGVQMKIPVSLYPDENGKPLITPAGRTSFSHILKFPGTAFHEPMAALEWMGLQMAQKAGLDTSKHALVELPGGMPPALIVERFDIPKAEDDGSKQYLIADFCTLMGKDPAMFKTGGNSEDLSRKLMDISSDPKTDAKLMFRKNALAWFISDYDMHMKNFSVLKTYDVATQTTDIRLSPVYDTLPTTVMPAKGDKDLSLKIGGRSNGLKLQNFVMFGKSLGLDEETVKAELKDTGERIARAAVEIASNPPSQIANHERCAFALKHAATEIVDRVKAFGYEVPEWTPVRPDSTMRKEMKRWGQENLPSLVMS